MDETELVEGIVWDRPHYTLNGNRLVPLISSGPTITEGCNSVTIRLDGRGQADLSWKKEREQAHDAVGKGLVLFWMMDLGLFDELKMGLDNQAQFLSLTLSLKHFRDTLWQEFKLHTLGISIYQGEADFEESDLDYLALLAGHLPDALPCYLFLNVKSTSDLLNEIHLLHPERFENLNLVLKGNSLPWKGWVWGDSHYYPHETVETKVAVCLPSLGMEIIGLERPLKELIERSIPFRLIAENHLITEWDGLDYLIFSPKGLSVQGKRKLQGFCAAGGTAVSIEEKIGLAHEILLDDYLQTI